MRYKNSQGMRVNNCKQKTSNNPLVHESHELLTTGFPDIICATKVVN